MPHPSTSPLLLGAHTSAAGGAWHALEEGAKIGATTVQLFTANQRRWQHPPLSASAIANFHEAKEKLRMQKIMSHASYLLNLGSPDAEGLQKSRQAFAEEITRCRQLGITYLNFHPGSALQAPREACLANIVESILATEPLLAGSDLVLLFEMTAGQGSNVGSSLEEVAYLIQHTKGRVPIGGCVDTCHIFAAGYDIRTPQRWDDFLQTFDQKIGLPYLRAFHLNDSKHPCASRKDRHAPLGEGHIGADAFRYLMQCPTTRLIPKYLETPGGPPLWKKELTLLRHWTTPTLPPSVR